MNESVPLSCSFSYVLFLLLICLFCPIPVSFVLFYILLYYYHLETCYLLVKDRNGVDVDGRGGGKKLGGVERGEM